MLHKLQDAAPSSAARRARRAPRIALIGGFGTGNFGNDASLETVLGLLRARLPDADLSVIAYDAALVREKFAIPAIQLSHRPSGVWRIGDNLMLRLPSSLSNWARALFAVGRYDAILFPGTGIFDDYRTGPLGFPSQVFRWCVAARLRGVRVGFLSVGAGPIINPLSRFFLKGAAQLAHYRSYRDTGSKEFMESIGVDESKSLVLPDIVFAMPAPDEPQRSVKNPLTIGLGVMSYRGWRINADIGADYLNKLTRFVRYLEGKGHRVRLLVAEPSDRGALATLEAKIGDGVDRGGSAPMDTLRDVMDHMLETDIVVGSRYHVLIAGLKLGRPTISLSYAPKHDLLLADAGLAEFCQNADYFDFDLLVRHFETIAADLPRYSRIVRDRVGDMRRCLADAEPGILAEIIGA